jgi:hypothetical protein
MAARGERAAGDRVRRIGLRSNRSGGGYRITAMTAGFSVLFPTGSVFCVDREDDRVQLGPANKPPNHQSFDVAVIEFQDDGSFVDSAQLKAATDCIGAARESNRSGALVVLFIHGWHHSAKWDVGKYESSWDAEADDDQHFRQFRRVLMGLAVREAERYLPPAGGRRIVGIYLGWHGDPNSWFGKWLSSTKYATHLSFYNRYKTAERVGAAGGLENALRSIVEITKRPHEDWPECPLVLAGHSMGALVLEAAFLSLLRESGDPLVQILDSEDHPVSRRSGVEVTLHGKRVAFPDVLLALNSAADSGLVREILGEFEKRQLAKRCVATDVGVDYAAPLLVSITSSTDIDTGVRWRVARDIRRLVVGADTYEGRYTDGHDPALRTHQLRSLAVGWGCQQKSGPDYGQDWHCLRFPVPRSQSTPSFAIDLPEISRNKPEGPIHCRYQLEPRFPNERRLAWLFEVPHELVKEHNDIFNARSSLLFMALIQISGAVVSLAEDIGRNFEPE